MNKISEIFPDHAVCILGLGYVGLTLAVAMASVGFQVDGVEIREDVVERLKNGQPHFFEPNLETQLRRLTKSGNLRISSKIPSDTKATVFVVTVGTPLDKTGEPRLDMIEAVSRDIASNMRPDSLIILRSTVRIGSTRNVVKPILDAANVHYDIAFCPERTVEGQALTELRQLPQIIGADNEAARQRAARLFNCLTPVVVQVSSPESAELIKLVDNTYRDISFAFANEIADLCDGLGISVIEVTQAGKMHYSRTALPLPGPVGGPCLEKDPHILSHSARGTGATVSIAQAARAVNERQPESIIARIAGHVRTIESWPAKPTIALLGLAFKGRPATGDLRGSMAIPLLSAIKKYYPDAIIKVFDPVADPAEVEEVFGLSPASSIKEAIEGASLALFATNHLSFQSIDLEKISQEMQAPALIYDLWNQFPALELSLPENVEYVGLGDGQIKLANLEKNGG